MAPVRARSCELFSPDLTPTVTLGHLLASFSFLLLMTFSPSRPPFFFFPTVPLTLLVVCFTDVAVLFLPARPINPL